MRTRLTRRGWALVGVVCLGVWLAARDGARALDAVVVPCLVALGAGVVWAARVRAPSVTRTLPAAAPVGHEGVVTLRFDPPGPASARIRDTLPEGLAGDPTGEAVLGADPVQYRVRYVERGRHEVGPVAVYTTDVLGLVETRRDAGDRDGLLVYPPVRDLPATALDLVSAAFVDGRSTERDEFDGLREYVRGDALRDVNWKASAKRDVLVVTEFAGAGPQGGVVLAAGGDPGRGDAMAEAAATLGAAVLRAGVPVTLLTADEERTVDPADREDLLAALATARAGDVSGTTRADVAVEALDEGVRIRIGGIETTFDRLLDGDLDRAAAASGPPVGDDGENDTDRDGRGGDARTGDDAGTGVWT